MRTHVSCRARVWKELCVLNTLHIYIVLSRAIYGAPQVYSCIYLFIYSSLQSIIADRSRRLAIATRSLFFPFFSVCQATFREGDTGRSYTRIIQRHKPLGGDARFGTGEKSTIAILLWKTRFPQTTVMSKRSEQMSERGGGKKRGVVLIKSEERCPHAVCV